MSISSLHKVKPKAVLFTGFPTSKSTNTSCPKSVVDAGQFLKEGGDSDRISCLDSLDLITLCREDILILF
jgi:hypothetical protein